MQHRPAPAGTPPPPPSVLPPAAARSSTSPTAPPRGSTFFVGRTTAQRPLPRVGGGLRGPRPLPTTPARSTVAVSSDPLAPAPAPRPYAPSSPAVPTSTIPLPSSSGILVHGGFWDLLAATGSRFYSPSRLEMAVANGAGTPSTPAVLGQDPFAREMGAAAGPTRTARQKKRVSVDMISRPRDFAHTVHASDADQAAALLGRWQRDGQGKVGDSSWAKPIKDAVRASHRAVGVAEAYYARDAPQQPLKVMNGLPESATSSATSSRTVAGRDVSLASNIAVEDDHDVAPRVAPPSPSPHLHRIPSSSSIVARSPPGSPLVEQAAAFFKGGTTRFKPDATARPGAPFSFDQLLPSPLASPTADGNDDDPFSRPTFVPSLATIERAVAAKTFLEVKYHALLKQTPSREARKALIERELSRLHLSDAERVRVRDAWILSESEVLRDMRRRVGIGSFLKIKTIGHGAFGVVSLVRERGSGELYALKQIRKADMLKKGQEGHIRAERDLLATASTSTRWTVKLHYSFQDVDHLYLAMDFMSGGDLLSLLIERDVFPESMARFYVAEMILALNETHSVLGAIHRDIKPDNFLLSDAGHLCLSDFGLAQDFKWAHDGSYYDQHRRELLYKFGVDLEDTGRVDPSAGRRSFDPPRSRENEEKPTGSVLTWRDLGRRQQAYSVVDESSPLVPLDPSSLS
ncbi:hypothetical protein JCM8208_005943 [Rhodotorula glutinis]